MKDYLWRLGVAGFIVGMVLFGIALSKYADAAELTPQEVGEIVAEAASTAGNPTRITQQQAESVYIVAYGQCPKIAGMSEGCPRAWLEEGPKVRTVHPSYVCGVMGQLPECSVLAVYSDGLIFLSSEVDMSTVLGASILLHEYIHHFQWLKRGKRPVTQECEWQNEEREAHFIEAAVLDAAGQPALADQIRLMAARYICRSNP